ncbi:hypothetical protein P7K49_001063 [Saguinus oedipus]|uniref:Chorein N-terminal domain-containing protein n=1 Tax=Saguinus oedipus TaxID=9490 RepID=A0ABQ9WH85_SAGOE|nr:hypothetical protein P7K49_001063 [Saguinus oedipus]
MVFESVVVDVLNRFLGDYVVDLDTSQLSLGIWKGNEAAAAPRPRRPPGGLSARAGSGVLGASSTLLARSSHLPPPAFRSSYVKPGGSSRASALELFIFWGEGEGHECEMKRSVIFRAERRKGPAFNSRRGALLYPWRLAVRP